MSDTAYAGGRYCRPILCRRLLGDAPALLRDPLGFLTHAAASADRVVELRLPFVRTLLLLDADDVETVLTAGGDDYVKPIWLSTDAVRRLLGDGVVTADGESWRNQRRVCQPAFHGRLMGEYAAIISVATESAMTEWRPDSRIDLLHTMTDLTMRIVGEAFFGDPMDGQRERLGQLMDSMMNGFRAPWKLFGLAPLPPSIAERRAGRELDLLIADVVKSASIKPQTRPTLLSMLHEFDPAAVHEQAKTFIAAGHESSALALTWLLVSLDGAPAIGASIASEVYDADAAADELPILQAAIKETLRLYPPLWMTGREATRDVVVGGVNVPRGAQLLTSQWAIQRSARYFEAPNSFDPQRWLRPEAALLPRFAYFPFGGGARGCIGQRFAMLELGIVAAAVLRRYRVQVEGTNREPWATMTLRPPVGLMATLTPR